MNAYRGLRLLVRVLRVLGWLFLAIAILLACFMVTWPFLSKEDSLANPLAIGVTASLGALTGTSFVVAGVALSLTLFFAAGVIQLLLDIEVNTSQTRELLRGALTKPDATQARPDGPAQGAAVPAGYKRP